MVFKILLVVIVVVIAFVVVAKAKLMASGGGSASAGKYKRRTLMTENENEFFGRLVNALPDFYIFPQVAMSAILEASSGDKKQVHVDRLRIAQQRIDYVVCNASCEIIAVVELDDKTHSTAKDLTRDERLQQAGIRTIRFQSRNKPSVDAIRASIVAVAQDSMPSAPANKDVAALRLK